MNIKDIISQVEKAVGQKMKQTNFQDFNDFIDSVKQSQTSFKWVMKQFKSKILKKTEEDLTNIMQFFNTDERSTKVSAKKFERQFQEKQEVHMENIAKLMDQDQCTFRERYYRRVKNDPNAKEVAEIAISLKNSQKQDDGESSKKSIRRRRSSQYSCEMPRKNSAKLIVSLDSQEYIKMPSEQSEERPISRKSSVHSIEADYANPTQVIEEPIQIKVKQNLIIQSADKEQVQQVQKQGKDQKRSNRISQEEVYEYSKKKEQEKKIGIVFQEVSLNKQSQKNFQEKSQEKVQEKVEEKAQEKSQEKVQEKVEEKAQEKVQEKAQEKVQEKAQEKSQEKVQEKAQEKSQEKVQEKVEEQSYEKPQVQTQEKVLEKAQENIQKKVQEKAEQISSNQNITERSQRLNNLYRRSQKMRDKFIKLSPMMLSPSNQRQLYNSLPLNQTEITTTQWHQQQLHSSIKSEPSQTLNFTKSKEVQSEKTADSSIKESLNYPLPYEVDMPSQYSSEIIHPK